MLAGIAVAAALWGLIIWLVGGFNISLAGQTITANDLFRPLAIAVVAAIAYAFIAGAAQVRRDIAGIKRSRRLATSVAVVLALCPAVAGLARNSWTAGGSDSYGYVSQADLWLHRNLKVQVPLADSVPWPDALWSFAPHGFRPGVDETALVPVYAPGLPLMMAAAKAVAGHCAMFWITPLFGSLLVWCTFVIGRRLHSGALGLAAAWLAATSPTVLAMLVSPMSDVPAAALWAAAIYFALGRTAGSDIACGLAASAAILVRPNLAPLALVIVVWKSVVSGFSRTFPVAQALRSVFLMTAGILPGCLIIAALNNWLYGSPLASGYGTLPNLFNVANVATNLRRYGGWLIESQTPFALAGIAALVMPWRVIWSTREMQRGAYLLAAIVATVWALYLIYTPFDAWWYLRFLLPSWPGMCLGTAALFVRAITMSKMPGRLGALAVLIGLGFYGINFAATRGAFPSGEGDHRYASIAKLVEQHTDPSSIIFAGQNAGTVRYYAGRATVRFDLLDDAWLDRAVEWLTQHGRRPYFLVEEWEIPLFQERFAARSKLGSLNMSPVLAYQAPGVPGSVFLFDPARAEGPTLRPVPPTSARPECVEPAPLLHLLKSL